MDISTLGMKVDASQVKAGADALDKLAGAGKSAERAVDGLTAATTKAGKAAAATAAATRQVAQEVGKQASATLDAAKAQATQAVAARSVEAAITRTANAAAKGATGFNTLAAGQKLTAYQSQQLGYQLNDLFVQISSGQSPLTALIQQGSQLNGTFGGFGGTLRAVGSLFTPLRVAIGGTLAAVSAIAASFISGRSESNDFAKSIALTGNAAGITEGQFNSLAKTVSESTNTTIGSTRETLQGLIESGRFSGEALEAAGKAAQSLARVSGQSTDDIVKAFVKAGGSVADFARQTNEQYHYLSATQLDYIKTLEDQGNSQKALQITFDALNGRIANAAQNLGILERGWNGVKIAASNAINQMLEIGRVPTPEGKIADFEKQLDYLNKFGGTSGRKQELQEQIANQQEILKLGRQGATIAAAAVERESAKTEFLKLQEKVLSKSEQRSKEIAKANALADKAGINAADRAKVIANIEEKYKDPKGPKGVDTSRVDARALLQFKIEDIKAAAAAEVDTINNTQKILEANHQANLITDEQYYAAKRDLVSKTAAESIKGLQAENDLLEKQGLNTKDGLDRDREVLKNKAEITKLSAAATTDLVVLAKQQEGAANRIAISLEQARAAAQSYVDTISRQNSREIAGLGKGSQSRDIDSRISQREDQYQSRKDQIEAQARAKQIKPEEAAETLAIEKAAHEKVLAADRDYWAKRLELQKDWTIGASEALQNYYDESQNLAKHMEESVGNSLKSIEDQLVNLFTGKKFDTKALFESISADFTRNLVKEQITGPLSKMAKDALGSGGLLDGVLGKAGGAVGTASASAAQASLAASAAGATAAITALATAAASAAAAMGGSSISSLFNGGNFSGLSADALSYGGYADGGYTGDGGKYQPAGIVHAGEYVVNAESTRRLGVGFLERLNKRGYADGGFVSPMNHFMPATSGTTAAAPASGPLRPIVVNQTFAAGTTRQTTDQAALALGHAIRRAQRNS